MARLRAFFAALPKTDDNFKVRLLSTSWHPVGAAAWRSYLAEVTSAAGIGPPIDELGEDWIVALADPGPGLSADKGGAIAQRLAAWGVQAHQALLVDDSEGNTASAVGVCDTAWLPQRQGMSALVLDYIESRTLGCCSWVAGAGDGTSKPMIVAAMGLVVTVVAVVAAAGFLLGRRRGAVEMASTRTVERSIEIQKHCEAEALLGETGPPTGTTAVRARKQST